MRARTVGRTGLWSDSRTTNPVHKVRQTQGLLLCTDSLSEGPIPKGLANHTYFSLRCQQVPETPSATGFQRPPADFLLKPWSTFSAVIGRKSILTPTASSTALAIAAAVGMIAVSPMLVLLYGPLPVIDCMMAVFSVGMS